MKTQQNKILSLLRQMKSVGVNSYDLTYIYHIKQAPTRILELRQQGHNIISHQVTKNRSVQYILLDPPKVNGSSDGQSFHHPWEVKLIPVKKNGYVFWESPEKVEPEQLDIFK